ncbi:MAG TPA: LytTR family DNA-binding domain-containing protein [Saprospiraceae bacterium]|nr:LytTR family DNA-binding domain-containing protein [Saprospiraceae bacterium]HPI07429.1 LytTR family DNA-binding domain-containing protein [Saprospiraceae bacterium]
MMPIRCLLVDDEHFALSLLEKFIADTPGLELVAACKSPIRAVEVLQSEPVDLLFLDIQMPVLSGTNLLRTISRKPVTIFTTAYPQHAVEAFDLNAVDYLLKPFSFERFTQAVDKALTLLRQQQNGLTGKPEGFLTVKADRKWVKIAFADIRYIEGWKEYVKIFTGTEKVITLESLNNLENLLPDTHFLRVHKSFIVAKDRVQKLDGEVLILENGTRIPVARARKKEVLTDLF